MYLNCKFLPISCAKQLCCCFHVFQSSQCNRAWISDLWNSSRCGSNKQTEHLCGEKQQILVSLFWGGRPFYLRTEQCLCLWVPSAHFKAISVLAMRGHRLRFMQLCSRKFQYMTCEKANISLFLSLSCSLALSRATVLLERSSTETGSI